jgi:hypothetical protein
LGEGGKGNKEELGAGDGSFLVEYNKFHKIIDRVGGV